MSLKRRVDELEERLNPQGEKVEMTLMCQTPSHDMKWAPEPFRPGHNLYSVSPYLLVVFTGGTEEQQRAALKRLRRQCQTDPWANRPAPALTGEQDARARTVSGEGESSNVGHPDGEDA